MIDLTRQPCVVCGKMSSDVLHQTTYPEYGYPGTFTMRRCNGCGLLVNSPRLDAAELANLYGKNYYFFARTASHEFNRIVKMYWRTIGRFEESQFPVKRLMDIGCGRGYFPAVLSRLGWNAAGIEISPDASQFAREKFGLDVFTGTAGQYAASQPATFPLVTAIDVIEHVPAPGEFIQAVSRIAESGGRIIIDTPNAAAAGIAGHGVLWKGFNPFHIFIFTIENLTSLLSRHGFAIERSFSYGNVAVSAGARERLIRGLRNAGMLPVAIRSYVALRKLAMVFETNPVRRASKTALMLKTQSSRVPPTNESGPLAATKTGDNIVVIARKM